VAWYNEGWDDGGDYFDSTVDTPDVKDILFGNDTQFDSHAQELFVEAFFNDNDAAYIDLVEYMHDEYGIDFEQEFDWQDFREWYG
jgi:hypothetical protein